MRSEMDNPPAFADPDVPAGGTTKFVDVVRLEW